MTFYSTKPLVCNLGIIQPPCFHLTQCLRTEMIFLSLGSLSVLLLHACVSLDTNETVCARQLNSTHSDKTMGVKRPGPSLGISLQTRPQLRGLSSWHMQQFSPTALVLEKHNFPLWGVCQNFHMIK